MKPTQSLTLVAALHPRIHAQFLGRLNNPILCFSDPLRFRPPTPMLSHTRSLLLPRAAGLAKSLGTHDTHHNAIA